MFSKEVDFRLAKMIIASMRLDGVITDAEMQQILNRTAEYYEPPLLAVDMPDGAVGDGVTVRGR